MTNDERVQELANFNHHFFTMVRLNVAMGIEIVSLSDGRAVMRLPWNPDLVGDPDRGILHGGAITALMDACCGGAAFMGLARPSMVATLDLRIDFLGAAAPGLEVISQAHCYKRTRSVAFVRGIAHHGDPDDPIAAAAGAFAIGAHLPGAGVG